MSFDRPVNKKKKRPTPTGSTLGKKTSEKNYKNSERPNGKTNKKVVKPTENGKKAISKEHTTSLKQHKPKTSHGKKNLDKNKEEPFPGIFVIIKQKFDKTGEFITEIGNYGLEGHNKSFVYTLLIFFLCILVVIVGWALTNKNAYEVIVGEKSVGIVSESTKITSQVLTSSIENVLQITYNTEVKLEDEVILKPVHANKKKMVNVDYVVSKIAEIVKYDINASIINVNGVPIGTLKTKDEVDEVFTYVYAPYIKNDPDAEATFVESVTVTNEFVPLDKIDNKEVVMTKLSSSTVTEVPYTIVSGDAFWKIAAKMDMTTERILELNKDLSMDSVLKVGQLINVEETKPFISVKTVEKETTTEVIEIPVQTKDNPDQPVSYSKLVQEGKEGEKENTDIVTRVNGIETGRVKGESVVKVAAEPRIIEVGTKTSSARR